MCSPIALHGQASLTMAPGKLDDECQNLLKAAMTDLGLSARAHDKVLRVARTIADLDHSDAIRPLHLNEAINSHAGSKLVDMNVVGIHLTCSPTRSPPTCYALRPRLPRANKAITPANKSTSVPGSGTTCPNWMSSMP